MGINIHVYSYWGVRTEWNDGVNDRIEEVYHIDKNKLDILTDCYSCEYMVFGVQLYDSGDSRWGEMVNSNEVDVNPEKLAQLKHDYMTQFKQQYPDQYEWLAAKPWQLVNLVHYS